MTVASLRRGKGHHVATIRTTEKVLAAIAKLDEERIGALVVIDRWGKLAGMFSERDVIRGLAQNGAAALDFEVHELMTPDVATCAPEDRIDTAMAMMTVHRVRHLPVMADGRIVGLVSIGDLVRYRLDEKEVEANVLLDIARAHH
ncbi:MAG TPA: CBS domain-containing protein [Stellaceae bacterium]|jgi:CBS domain-containing protein|nr:CBS domain-containing protein [Stellaceae bacterium]